MDRCAVALSPAPSLRRPRSPADVFSRSTEQVTEQRGGEPDSGTVDRAGHEGDAGRGAVDSPVSEANWGKFQPASWAMRQASIVRMSEVRGLAFAIAGEHGGGVSIPGAVKRRSRIARASCMSTQVEYSRSVYSCPRLCSLYALAYEYLRPFRHLAIGCWASIAGPEFLHSWRPSDPLASYDNRQGQLDVAVTPVDAAEYRERLRREPRTVAEFARAGDLTCARPHAAG